MDYLLLVYSAAQPSPTVHFEQACRAHDEWLRQHEHLLAVIRLPADQTITLNRRQGQLELRNGPNAVSDDALAAVYLIRARDLNNAIHIAAQMPQAVKGAIEVRPATVMALSSGD